MFNILHILTIKITKLYFTYISVSVLTYKTTALKETAAAMLDSVISSCKQLKMTIACLL